MVWTAFSIASTATRMLRLISPNSSLYPASRSLARAPASSIRSMALSGRNRSVMYRLDWYTAASMASRVYSTWWNDS